MKIGVTYNPYKENEQLILNLSDKIDFVEVKNLETSLLRSKANILNRFPMKSMHAQNLLQEMPATLNLVSDETKEIISDENSDIYKAFDLLKPFLISFHLGFSSKLVGSEGIDNHNFAIGEVLSRKDVFKRICESLDTVKDVLSDKGYEGMILIENLDYHPTGAYEYVCEPEFISKIARKTKCRVLLDIAHTIISAHEFKMDTIDFVKKAGIDLIYEVHVNSPLWKDGKWYDINEPFYYSTEGKETVKYILERSLNKRLVLVNIESENDIAGQIELIREMGNNVVEKKELRRTYKREDHFWYRPISREKRASQHIFAVL